MVLCKDRKGPEKNTQREPCDEWRRCAVTNELVRIRFPVDD